MHQPLHYSVVAQRLGLSKSTAYDMLRLLEKKGFVTSEYATPKKVAGPGRSSVLFLPTSKAHRILGQLGRGGAEDEEWEDIKARIFARLSQGEAAEYASFIRELLELIPKTSSPLACCAEIITALLLSLKEAEYKLGPGSPLNKLLAASGSKVGMSILAGVATGLMAADNISHGFFAKRFEQEMQRYEEAIEELGPEGIEALNGYTRELMGVLSAGE